MFPGLPLGPWKPSSSRVDDVDNLGIDTEKRGGLKQAMNNFCAPHEEHGAPMKILTEDLSSKWPDVDLGMPCGQSPAIVTLGMDTLVGQLMFTQSNITNLKKRRRRRPLKKKPGKIQESDMSHDEELDEPKVSPVRVKPVVPRVSAAQVKPIEQEKSYDVLVDEKDYTTVVVKNIPRHYTLDHLFQVLSALGLGKGIDYMNLFEDKRGGKNRGYAFVNFMTNELALQCMDTIDGYVWTRPDDSTTEVQNAVASWALIQGFAANNSKHPMVAGAHQI